MHKGLAVNLKHLTKVNCLNYFSWIANRCFLCLAPCGDCKATCSACLSDLVFNANACPRCAKPNSASKICADCLDRPWVFIDHTWALLQYHYPANHMIQHMKFKQGLDIANALGWALGGLSLYPGALAPDCIIPVPLHSSRLISRGYNQSVELARPLSKQLGVPLDIVSCERVRATKPQSDLPTNKRKKNVRDAFSVSEGFSYGHVLLIDDVITTGSTVNELARTLRLAGACKIDVLACARAG